MDVGWKKCALVDECAGAASVRTGGGSVMVPQGVVGLIQ